MRGILDIYRYTMVKKEKEKKVTIGVSNLKWNAANRRKGKGVRTRTTSTKANVVPLGKC